MIRRTHLNDADADVQALSKTIGEITTKVKRIFSLAGIELLRFFVDGVDTVDEVDSLS